MKFEIFCSDRGKIKGRLKQGGIQMATYTNQATLTYNGNTTNSNTVVSEVAEVLSATKRAVTRTYNANGTVTYAVSIVNTGNTAFTNLTLTDNLGEYSLGTASLVPLSYVDGSVLYYSNGALQTAPTVTAGPPLTISGISVPANGDVLVVYEAKTNEFAPVDTTGTITNSAVISGDGLLNSLTVTDTISSVSEAVLTINKAVCPSSVSENGQLTFTFVIQNTGNTPANAGVVLTDNLSPILNPITVTYNDNAWTEGTNYTYNAETGAFATLENQITVPAATFTQNTETGTWTLTPGITTIKITGTV